MPADTQTEHSMGLDSQQLYSISYSIVYDRIFYFPTNSNAPPPKLTNFAFEAVPIAVEAVFSQLQHGFKNSALPPTPSVQLNKSTLLEEHEALHASGHVRAQ